MIEYSTQNQEVKEYTDIKVPLHLVSCEQIPAKWRVYTAHCTFPEGCYWTAEKVAAITGLTVQMVRKQRQQLRDDNLLTSCQKDIDGKNMTVYFVVPQAVPAETLTAMSNKRVRFVSPVAVTPAKVELPEVLKHNAPRVELQPVVVVPSNSLSGVCNHLRSVLHSHKDVCSSFIAVGMSDVLGESPVAIDFWKYSLPNNMAKNSTVSLDNLVTVERCLRVALQSFVSSKKKSGFTPVNATAYFLSQVQKVDASLTDAERTEQFETRMASSGKHKVTLLSTGKSGFVSKLKALAMFESGKISEADMNQFSSKPQVIAPTPIAELVAPVACVAEVVVPVVKEDWQMTDDEKYATGRRKIDVNYLGTVKSSWMTKDKAEELITKGRVDASALNVFVQAA